MSKVKDKAPEAPAKEKVDLTKILADINKKYGNSVVIMGAAGRNTEWLFSPSGSLGLDIAIGAGIPVGAPIIIQGKEGIGKSTLAWMICAEVQKRGGNIAIIDAEQAISLDHARNVGLVIPEEGEEYPEGYGFVALHQPQVEAEKTLDLVDDLIKTNLFAYVVIDSVPALVPKAEIDGGFQDMQMSLQARLMAKAMRKLVYTGELKKAKTSLLIINQVGDKIGGYAGMTEAKAGRALRFASIVTLEVNVARNLDIMVDGVKQRIGHVIGAKVVKNKVGAPYRTAEITLYYERGVDRLEEAVTIGALLKIVEVAGSWYKWVDPETGEVYIDKVQGKDKFKLAFLDKPELFDQLVELIKTKMYD